MNILEIDEKPAETKTENTPPITIENMAANPDELERLLSGYTEPAKVDAPPAQPAGTPPPVAQPTQNGAPNWYGNPAYFQRGKKKGQLRPNGQRYSPAGVNMSVNPAPTEIAGDIISGALFLSIINLLFPMLFSVLNNMVSKKKIAYEDLQIDDKALKNLEQLSDKALKSIKIEANPVAVLFVTMLGLYTLQFMTVKMIQDIKPKLHVSK